MEDKYLEWLEDRITEVVNAQLLYGRGKTPKLARDIEKILETLEVCKSQYIQFKERAS